MTFKLIIRNLLAHPFRTILTMGSVLFAVTLLSILTAAVTSLTATIDAASTKRLWVQSAVSLFVRSCCRRFMRLPTASMMASGSPCSIAMTLMTGSFSSAKRGVAARDPSISASSFCASSSALIGPMTVTLPSSSSGNTVGRCSSGRRSYALPRVAAASAGAMRIRANDRIAAVLTGRRLIEQRDRLLELVDTALHALGDDRVRSIVGGDVEPRHLLLLDLLGLVLLVHHEPLDGARQERLERLHEDGGPRVPDRDDLDRAFRIVPVELLHDADQAAHLRRGLRDHERVLLGHRGDRAVGRHHRGELLGERVCAAQCRAG